MKSFLPTLDFQIMDIDQEANLLYGFSKYKRWIYVFEKKYPDLFLQLKENSDNKKVCIQICKNYVEKLRIVDRDEIKEIEIKLRFEWRKIETNYLQELSNLFETDWPEDKPKIICYISTLPVYPRFLDKYSFAVGYRNLSDLVESIAHEILHFIYFKKWKEVFPEINKEEYESPHLVWRLSEIMDPIILQCDLKINELIKPKKWGYSSFKEIFIGDLIMTDYFKKIYLDSIEQGNSFETTLKKLWKEIQLHDKEITF